jgi:type IV pilus assembly protein PilC
MPKFKFQSSKITGERIIGVKRANSPEELESLLAEEGQLLESFTQQEASLAAAFYGWLKKSEITRLTRQLAVLISSGITILETLESVREQTTDRRIGRVFDQIILSVQSGEPIHIAFGKYPAYFDSIYVSLLETGEMSGTLDTSLDRIAVYRERTEKVNKKIKSTLAYPALVLLVSVVIIFTLVTYIIPIFSSMYSGFGMELPALTQKVVNISDILKRSLWLAPFIIMVILLLVGLVFRSNRLRTAISKILMHLPIVGNMFIKLAASRFCRTLGTLLTSGLPLIEAVPVASRTVGNRYIEKRLNSVTIQLFEGTSLATSLEESNIFPRTVIRMTAAGESTGRLGEMFSKTADFYESEIDTEIATMTSLIEPIVIICLGLIIAVILIAMYLPLFDLIGQIGY